MIVAPQAFTLAPESFKAQHHVVIPGEAILRER